MGTITNTRRVNDDCYYHSASYASGNPRISMSKQSKAVSSRTGTSNPKWKQIIANGGNATTALDAYTQYVKVFPGLIKYKMTPYGGGGNTFSNTYCGLSGPYEVSPADLTLAPYPTLKAKAEAIATTMVYNRLTELQAPFAGQVFTGELREVLDMIKNPLAASAVLVENFLLRWSDHVPVTEVNKRRGRRRHKFASHKDLANAWLEFSFAIKPLISDIADLLDLARKVSEQREHDLVRGYGKSISSTNVVQNGNAGTTGLAVRSETITLFQAQCIIRCGLTKEFLEQVRADTDNLRNSLDDIFTLPETIYDLTPFTWLLDYFVNIGDIIGAAAVSKAGIAWTSKSFILTKEIKAISGNATINRTDLISEISFNQPKMVIYGVRRVIRDSTLAGIPPVVFSLPGRGVQYANVLALLTKLTTK